MKILLMLVSILFLVGCGTVKTIPYPYENVSDVLKDKLVNKDDEFTTTKPKVTETPETMEILFSVDKDFYFSITPMITIKKVGDNKTKVTVKVTEYFKSWSYQSRSKKMETEFIDVLKNRMATGKWKPLPWERDENIKNRSVFSAMFQNFGE